MKKFAVLTMTAIFIVGMLAIGAFAADDHLAQVRIVNKSAVKGMMYDDKGLMTLANLDVSKNTKIFPLVSNFSIIAAGKEYVAGTEIPCKVVCPINISSTIKENEKLDFTTVQDPTAVGATLKEFNIAVVKMDGKVTRVNDAADIDYSKKTLVTAKPIPLAEGDTILVFVSDVPHVYYEYQGIDEGQGYFPY